MDNQRLINQVGKIAPSEVQKFRTEVNKRLAAIKEEECENYKTGFKKVMGKNLASLSQEDRNKRKKEILEVIINKKKAMNMKEYRQEELDLHDYACEGPFHNRKRKG